MRRRGSTLLLLLVTAAVAVACVAIFATRFSVNVEGRKGTALRAQTLWLSRSGCLAGLAGKLEAKTALGPALVSREGAVVRTALNGAHAEVTCATLEERYTAP